MRIQRYIDTLDECRGMLSDAGLVAPRPKLKLTTKYLSYTDTKDIYIGMHVRVFSGFGYRGHLRLVVLHELMHILVSHYPPRRVIQEQFGSAKEWEGDQRFGAMFFNSASGYVSRYALTHPEEDFVETAVACLLNHPAKDDGTYKKTCAVRQWFKRLRVRKKRMRIL